MFDFILFCFSPSEAELFSVMMGNTMFSMEEKFGESPCSFELRFLCTDKSSLVDM